MYYFFKCISTANNPVWSQTASMEVFFHFFSLWSGPKVGLFFFSFSLFLSFSFSFGRKRKKERNGIWCILQVEWSDPKSRALGSNSRAEWEWGILPSWGDSSQGCLHWRHLSAQTGKVAHAGFQLWIQTVGSWEGSILCGYRDGVQVALKPRHWVQPCVSGVLLCFVKLSMCKFLCKDDQRLTWNFLRSKFPLIWCFRPTIHFLLSCTCITLLVLS